MTCSTNFPNDGVSTHGDHNQCPTGAYLGNVNLGFENMAIDPVGRRIWVIDPYFHRLLEYNMTTNQTTIKARPPYGSPSSPYPCHGQAPEGPGSQDGLNCHDYTWLWWTGTELLYPFVQSRDISRVHLAIFHPDSGDGTWTTDPMITQPAGLEVRGNTFFFDPIHNVLMTFGGLCSGWSPTVCDGNYTPHPETAAGVNGTLSSTGTSVTVTNAPGGNPFPAAGQLVKLTSGPQSGEYRIMTSAADSTHYTINAAFSADQSGVTWARAVGNEGDGTSDPNLRYFFVYRFGASAQQGNLLIVQTVGGSGETITVSPADTNGSGDIVTSGTRIYGVGQSVTLTAPATASGNPFASWTGCDSVSVRTCTVAMTSQKTVTVTYTVVAANRTLTVQSSNPNSGVSMTVSPADNNSATNGTTNFARIYKDGTAVTVTAAPTASGNTFSNWSGCDSNPSSQTCSVMLGGDRVVTANYAFNGPAWPVAPSGLMTTCNTANTQATLSWSALHGATDYAVRLNYLGNDGGPTCQFGDATSPAWYCGDPPDKVVNTTTGATSLTVNVTAGAPYRWWVHGLSGGNYGDAQAINFNCGNQFTLKLGGTAKCGPNMTCKIGVQ